ncbi:MAG: hypothetical protein QM489_02945 [Candidatus Izemoplasma sp.]
MKLIKVFLFVSVLVLLGGCSDDVDDDDVVDGDEELIINIEKDSIIAEALVIENAAQLFCALQECSLNEILTWDDLTPFISLIFYDHYDLTNNDGKVAFLVSGEWEVDMERIGTGEYELIERSVPSELDRDKVIEDLD